MSQMELFDEAEVRDDDYRNPMVVLHGKGPEGARCKTCEHFGYVQYANKYYKCELRGMDGPSTDHRVNYRACKKYEPEVLA